MSHPLLDYIVRLQTDTAAATAFRSGKQAARDDMNAFGLTDTRLQNILLEQHDHDCVANLQQAVVGESPEHIAPGGRNNVVCNIVICIPNAPTAP